MACAEARLSVTVQVLIWLAASVNSEGVQATLACGAGAGVNVKVMDPSPPLV